MTVHSAHYATATGKDNEVSFVDPSYWEFLFNRGQIHDVAFLSRKNYGEISVPTMGITNSSTKPHQQVQKHNEVNIYLFTTFITSEKL
jgi:hypothetical protein